MCKSHFRRANRVVFDSVVLVLYRVKVPSRDAQNYRLERETSPGGGARAHLLDHLLDALRTPEWCTSRCAISCRTLTLQTRPCCAASSRNPCGNRPEADGCSCEQVHPAEPLGRLPGCLARQNHAHGWRSIVEYGWARLNVAAVSRCGGIANERVQTGCGRQLHPRERRRGPGTPVAEVAHVGILVSYNMAECYLKRRRRGADAKSREGESGTGQVFCRALRKGCGTPRLRVRLVQCGVVQQSSFRRRSQDVKSRNRARDSRGIGD